MNTEIQNVLRQLPSVDQLLRTEKAKALTERFGRPFLKQELQRFLDEHRQTLRKRIEENGDHLEIESELSPEQMMEDVQQQMEQVQAPSLRRVVNGTGIILHTGLGRAVLAPEVLERIQDIHQGYSMLEVEPETGDRFQREHACSSLLGRLIGSERATVVNNNAAAVTLILSTFARGQEVIISRGELVEIGGSFRIPDVMEQSGAELVEVGTTNKTSLSDYEEAITEETAAIMKVHTSNYRIVGFQDTPSTSALSSLAEDHDVHFFEDLGSGALTNFSRWNLDGEPGAGKALEDGAELVCFSGDKLLGGPQAGIIAGREELVKHVRNHPLFRAFRPDKLILTALEATLQLYLSTQAEERIPALQMISRSTESIRKQAQQLQTDIEQLDGFESDLHRGTSRTGGGSLPNEELSTWLVEIRSEDMAIDELAYRMRMARPSVFGRIQDERLLLDPRTLVKGDHKRIKSVLKDTRHQYIG